MSTAIAPLVFVVLGILLTYPFVLHLADHLIDYGDSYEYAWVMGFGAYQITHHPLHLFDGNIFYPYPLSLAYSDSTVPSIVLGAPIVLLTNNPVLALNVLILSTYVLGGYGMYLLVSQRTGSRVAGLVAGIAYGFSPYRNDHLAQIPNVSMQWAPFALWSLDRFVTKDGYRWAAGFALFCVLQVLVSFYYAFILGIGIAIYVLAMAIGNRQTFFRPHRLIPLATCCLGGAFVALPFIRPYFELERAFGLQRTIGEAVYFSAWPANYLAPTMSTRVVLIDPLIRLLYRQPWNLAPLGASERHLYPGLLVVLLAAAGLLTRRWTRSIPLAFMVVVGVALSFGPDFHLHNGVAYPVPFPMPYRILFDYLPGFTALRVPSRFAALVVFGLAILAGDGVAAIQGRLRTIEDGIDRRGIHGWVDAASRLRYLLQPRRMVPALLMSVAILESLTAFSSVPVKVGDAVPPVYRWLASDSNPGPVVELPIDDNAFHESPRSYYSTYYHRPLLDGFRSFLPPTYAPLALTLASFPSREAIDTLERLNVRNVVVHQAEIPAAFDREQVPTWSGVPGVRLAARFGTDYVFQLVGPANPEHLDVTFSAPNCLPPGPSAATFQTDLRAPDGIPIITLAPGTRALDFQIEWEDATGSKRREISSVPVSSPVLPSPIRLAVPFQPPSNSGFHAATMSIVHQPNVVTQSVPQHVAVAGPAAEPSSQSAARLGEATLLSPRTTAARGVVYELDWQTSATSGDPVVVFVNAYDANGRYWSYPSGKEARFPGAMTCPGGFMVEGDRLNLLPDTPPGRYWIEAGLRDLSTGQRVPFVGPDGQTVTHHEFGSFWVYPPGVYPPGAASSNAQQNVHFGGNVVLESSGVSGVPSPGATVRVNLRWRTERTMTVDYTTFVHLVDSSGHLVAQHDVQPTNGVYPTSAWRPGESIVDAVDLTLPDSLPPGRYQVQVGLYDVKTGARLPVLGADGQVIGDHVDLPVASGFS